MTPREIAICAAKALDSKKGQEIKVLETGHLTTLADYFVICTAPIRNHSSSSGYCRWRASMVSAV